MTSTTAHDRRDALVERLFGATILVNRLARRFTIVHTVGLMDHQSILVVVT
jgi:hypothetical protein